MSFTTDQHTVPKSILMNGFLRIEAIFKEKTGEGEKKNQHLFHLFSKN